MSPRPSSRTLAGVVVALAALGLAPLESRAVSSDTFTLNAVSGTIDLAKWVTSATTTGTIAYYPDGTTNYPASNWFHTGTPTTAVVSFTCQQASHYGSFCNGTFSVSLAHVNSTITGFGVTAASGITIASQPAPSTDGADPYTFTFTFTNAGSSGSNCYYSACSGSFNVGVETSVTPSTNLTAGSTTQLGTYTVTVTCPSSC